jgi:methionyl-tRNA formyltransferase
VLAIPRVGCWNVHASLLPRWRGAAPIQRAILAGDAKTGVDLMQMEAGLDTGPVLVERRTPIHPEENAQTLHDLLAALGADALTEGLDHLIAGKPLVAKPQSEQGVEYAHKIEKGEARLDWREPAIVLARKVRAFNPWPVAEGEIDGERLRIWNATAIAEATSAPPGTIVDGPRDTLDVATGDGILRVIEIQREGGRRMSARDYKNARRDRGAAS